ncbi:MAG: iron ABC transporter permease [Microthrixaceae bacterium]
MITVLGVAVVIGVVVSAGTGQYALGLDRVVSSLIARISRTGSGGLDAAAESVLWDVRMPRLVMAVLVGAALGVAGALMQGLFRNPLAEPAVVGVSSGAAVGACVAIVSGINLMGSLTAPVAAFAGAVTATAAVYLLSRSTGHADTSGVVLMGVAVNAIAAAGIGVAVVAAGPRARQDILFWQLGSLNGTRWVAVGAALPLLVVGLVAAVLLSRSLDLLSLGESTARHLGVDVERSQVAAIATVALLVGPATAFCGIIGFVGLVVAHALRIVLGPRHRPLIIGSALGGALVMVVADTAARTAVAHAELPVGMLTALVGGPVFLLLLRRRKTLGVPR